MSVDRARITEEVRANYDAQRRAMVAGDADALGNLFSVGWPTSVPAR
jgi:hypothetical protein